MRNLRNLPLLLVVVTLLVIQMAAFAAGDPTQPLWGWNPVVVGAFLGFATPYITALFTKLHWAKWQKLLTLYGVSLVLAAIGGVLVGAITTAGLKSDGIIELITALFTTGKVTYDALNGSVKATAKATESKKN